jgi:tetratricopeptide (TPR) repeat protein
VPLLLALGASLSAAPAGQWLRLSTPHFELLTDAAERDGQEALLHFERLRRFFVRVAALPEDALGNVRIIAFRSPEEYAPYRLNETADAYHVGYGARDYIVLPSLGRRSLSIAAHEYAHVFARHQGLQAPAWLSEGLAEVFSTISFQGGQAKIGAPKPGTLRQLRTGRWLPLAEVLAGTRSALTRAQSAMFYAESWALTDMLMLSPAYLPRFKALLAGGAAPVELYSRSADELERDLRAWVHSSRLPEVVLPDGGGVPDAAIQVEPLPLSDRQTALAELLSASGMREAAEAAWRRLEAARPSDPGIQAALGRLALARGNHAEVRERYRRAVALGIDDAQLCADYATLARDAGLPESEVIAAFERALALDPAMDDARYNLALLHMNAGRYAAALPYFERMGRVPEARAFAYWTSLAHTQTELGLREEAAKSAAEARRHARTDEDRALANDLAWMAVSETVVQLSPAGPARLRRIPLRPGGDPEEVNPFIAPGDRVERREGVLREVDCAGKETRLTVQTAGGAIVLSLPDPGRVQVRKTGSGSFEFTCGPQQDRKVWVEYAIASDPSLGVAGILRGIELR